jgi:hypothetical protein
VRLDLVPMGLTPFACRPRARPAVPSFLARSTTGLVVRLMYISRGGSSERLSGVELARGLPILRLGGMSVIKWVLGSR